MLHWEKPALKCKLKCKVRSSMANMPGGRTCIAAAATYSGMSGWEDSSRSKMREMWPRSGTLCANQVMTQLSAKKGGMPLSAMWSCSSLSACRGRTHRSSFATPTRRHGAFLVQSTFLQNASSPAPEGAEGDAEAQGRHQGWACSHRSMLAKSRIHHV